jgi:hypothetical protein
MTKDTVDCNDPKNKDNGLCAFGRGFGEILAFPALVAMMTLGVWILGGIAIALIWHHTRPQHRTRVLLLGILLCVLIAPIGILLLQRFAHWPMRDL